MNDNALEKICAKLVVDERKKRERERERKRERERERREVGCASATLKTSRPAILLSGLYR